jgi:NAD(P)-dependent dehydrogenase (short-subunit alcohol dehydrogenase family)
VFQQDLLKGRAIFLTGGGTGLGRSMALQFAKLGARLFLVGRREEPLKEACAEIHRQGGAAAYATCDVREYDAVESAFSSAEQQYGEIDSLVNNAAGNFLARTETLTPNGFSAVVGIVLIARRLLAVVASRRNSAEIS